MLNKKKGYILTGVTGGIATGKSMVSNEMKRMGGYLIEADVIAREIVMPDTPAWKDIKRVFSNNILNKDRYINRKRLAKIIFNDSEKRRVLEEITHPAIIDKQNRIIIRLQKEGYKGLIIIDAPLLIESGYHRNMDKVVVVYANREIQLRRLMERDNISQVEAEKRIDAQMPLEKKLNYADFIIYNNSTKDEVKKEARKVYKKIYSLILP